MAESPWPTIHTERAALAHDLESLTPDQWSTPSLCAGWSVADVLAHQVSTAKMTPGRFFARFAGRGFSFTRFADKGIAAEGAAGPAAALQELRRVQTWTKAPPGPKDTWLGEAIVHAEDIRRPLGIRRDYPVSAVTRVLDTYVRSNAIIGGKKRVAGLTLKATDAEWSHGSGPLVEGPALALLLATAGRTRALTDLTGPGVELLAAR